MPKKQNISEQITSTLAKQEDGSVQITFVVPWNIVEKAKAQALGELSKEAEIPGFRKGKAPVEKVKENLSESLVVEKALGKLLPEALGLALIQYKLAPAIYPKFELVSAKDQEDWQVRALTCELPEVKLGDYKSKIAGEIRAKHIWTPGTGDSKDKVVSKEQKEQDVLKLLLSEVKLNIPKILIDEEVNSRLAALLQRTEKLGLSLESYLSSLGKTPETIRAEYEIQAKNTISLELILNKIAEEEKIKITDAQIEEVIQASSQASDAKTSLDPEQRRLISSFLARRAALDSLVNL